MYFNEEITTGQDISEVYEVINNLLIEIKTLKERLNKIEGK